MATKRKICALLAYDQIPKSAKGKEEFLSDIQLHEWAEALRWTALSGRQKNCFAVTIRWYLSAFGRSRSGVNHQSARSFIERAQEEENPQLWQLEEWMKRKGAYLNRRQMARLVERAFFMLWQGVLSFR